MSLPWPARIRESPYRMLEQERAERAFEEGLRR